MTTLGTPYGVVVAMQAEARHLLERADSLQAVDGGVYHAWRATFAQTQAIIVVSGIGMVLSAAATQWLLSAHNPASILNFGCAGAHRPDIDLGDVIVGTRAIPHYAMHILPDGRHHYVGFVSEEGFDLLHVSSDTEARSSPDLVERAARILARGDIEPWPGRANPPAWHVGPVGSADVWTQQQERIRNIHDEHQTLCEDMEAASIGKIANVHGVPFLTVKDISNNEFQKHSNLSDFSEFPYDEVGKRAGRVIAGLLRGDLEVNQSR
ncbi:MAG: 5'-methylthioadenosine/S-adenosylhomocysteine nucleosidase [Thermomicrobiales bacterium]